MAEMEYIIDCFILHVRKFQVFFWEIPYEPPTAYRSDLPSPLP